MFGWISLQLYMSNFLGVIWGKLYNNTEWFITHKIAVFSSLNLKNNCKYLPVLDFSQWVLDTTYSTISLSFFLCLYIKFWFKVLDK